MRTSTLIAAAAIILGLTVAGSSQAAAQSQEITHTTKKTFGYMDSRGVFHAIPRATPDAAGTQTYSGTLEVDVTITVLTQVAMREGVVCEADFTASSIENATQSVTVSYEETATVPGKSSSRNPTNPTVGPVSEVTAETVTCKILIPYSWTLPAGPIHTSEYVNSLEGDLSLAIVTTTTNTTTGVQTQTVWRTSQLSIPDTKFPEEGGTTKYAVKATL
jgi:hypothetical protein